MDNYLWIIPFAPLIGAIINGKLSALTSHRESGPNEKLISFVGCVAPLASFVVAVVLFVQMTGMDPAQRKFQQTLFDWIVAGPIHVQWAYWIDQLSMVMVLVVTCVGTIIHFYSIGYMHGDRGFARYFSYLNLFMFAMLTLVMGQNLVMLFVGWEGVGLCSYLLIGFWYKDMLKAAAGKKAFIVNRIGDFAFLIGMFLLFDTTARIGYATLDVPIMKSMVAQHPEMFSGAATAACILLFIGACGKSAQIPLYVWLPDAMAGPTPVSALIHAATMVTAGVYMVARMGFLYELAPVAMAVVAIVGAVTAIFAASIGICQRDIKKVLAYSTVSQLGYMFIGVGVGAFSAGIFHLMTHAFFKACLFLCAGSVIHAMSGEQDMFKMGALAKPLKITMATFFIASMAIAGFPGLAGFFSKDEILWSAYNVHVGPPWLGTFLWVVGFVTAGITAFYIFRAVFLTFFGESRVSDEAKHHLHESPAVMTVPLVLLAAGSLAAGYLGVPQVLKGSNLFHHFLAPVFGAAHGAAAGHGGEAHSMIDALGAHGQIAASAGGAGHGLEVALMVASVLIGIAGIVAAYLVYLKNPDLPRRAAAKAWALYTLVFNKYYVDEMYEHTLVRPGYQLSDRFFFRFVDMGIIEGVVNGLGIGARLIGSAVRLLQSGVVRTYALFMFLGLLYMLYRLLT
jgi:NADH-quinone oxidoreductase subunit L